MSCTVGLYNKFQDIIRIEQPCRFTTSIFAPREARKVHSQQLCGNRMGQVHSTKKGDLMSKTKFYKTETTANDGTPLHFVYDQEADILEIFFGSNEPATGVELTDYILLRLNK